MKAKGYLLFLILSILAFATSTMMGVRFFGSQSDKWSPEQHGQSHK